MKWILFLRKINYFSHHKQSTYSHLTKFYMNYYDIKLIFLQYFQQNILFINLINAKTN